jgi:putative flippase GtrA
MVGKPSELTYYHAEYLISHHASELGLKLPIKRLYAVGVSLSFLLNYFTNKILSFKDNPETDIYGANIYNRYLQKRSLSRLNQVVSQTATATLTSNARSIVDKHFWNSPNPVELIVDDAERYYSAESLESILVCTGVYNRETYDEVSSKSYAHRDIIIDCELKIPKHTCEHVLDAVELIFNLEQFY